MAITKPFVRNPYNYDTEKASDESAIQCKDEHKAQQQFAEESDINFIANRYGLTAEMPTLLQPPTYADYEEVFDFQSANNIIVRAKNDFMQLPAKIRSRMNNDPGEYLAFMNDPDNTEEAIKLGLATKKPADAPQSPQGNAGAKAGGDTPSQPAKAPAKPATPPNTDT